VIVIDAVRPGHHWSTFPVPEPHPSQTVDQSRLPAVRGYPASRLGNSQAPGRWKAEMTVEQELREVLVNDLRALNGAEHRLVLRLEDIAADVAQGKLKKTLLTQRDITQKRRHRLEKVFKSIDAEPQEAESQILDEILDAAERDGEPGFAADLGAATAVLQAVQFQMGGYDAAIKLATQLKQSKAESRLARCAGELEHAGQEMEKMIEEVASEALKHAGS
jgi:ferritin-like metal-binding protein YciE